MPGRVLDGDAVAAAGDLGVVLDLAGIKHLFEPVGGGRRFDEFGELLHFPFELVQRPEMLHVENADEHPVVVLGLGVQTETQSGEQT